MQFNLAKLAQRPKGAAVELPPITESLGATQSFLKAEREMLRGMSAFVRETILPEAEREIARGRSKLTQDMGRDTFITLEAVAKSLAGAAAGLVQRILSLEGERHTAQFKAAAKRALGVDLSAVVRDEDLDDYLRNAGTRAASLITGLADDVAKRIANSVTTAIINGNPVKDLRKTLVEDFRIGDRRAQLIARDQIAKVNSDLNKQRHLQAGVTEYTWLTSHDERVRERHRGLDGKVYTYGKPTGAEGGLEPGQPIRCRCVARGIVTF